ncbi:MAG: glutaminyl-peptide cyclotransferase [Bacteroidales bacterium]
MNSKLQILTVLSLGLIVGCSNGRGDQSSTSKNIPVEKPIHLIRFDSPTNGKIFEIEEIIQLTLKLMDANTQPDSIILSVNNKEIAKLQNLTYEVSTKDFGLGTLNIRATAWKNGQRQTASINVFLKSNIIPQKQVYKVIKTYSHDPNAYTQGLFVYNGFLYEGTGQNGASSLRKVELTTGKVLQSANLNQDYFGEGITLLNGKIYQLTWTSGIGFVYELESFKKLNSFNYTTQGWGLTTNGTDLIMSDGSNIIYFMEPDGFSEVRRIEVYDNNGPVRSLNELEYIDGKIWANVYTTDRVVVIDPKTGVVVSEVDFSNILKNSDRTGNEDVLNGIAYDITNKHLYVTGKYWPKLFQVEIVSK